MGRSLQDLLFGLWRRRFRQRAEREDRATTSASSLMTEALPRRIPVSEQHGGRHGVIGELSALAAARSIVLVLQSEAPPDELQRAFSASVTFTYLKERNERREV